MELLSNKAEEPEDTIGLKEMSCEQTEYSNEERVFALSNFLSIGSGLFMNIQRNINSYYNECANSGITPIRHLQ